MNEQIPQRVSVLIYAHAPHHLRREWDGGDLARVYALHQFLTCLANCLPPIFGILFRPATVRILGIIWISPTANKLAFRCVEGGFFPDVPRSWAKRYFAKSSSPFQLFILTLSLWQIHCDPPDGGKWYIQLVHRIDQMLYFQKNEQVLVFFSIKEFASWVPATITSIERTTLLIRVSYLSLKTFPLVGSRVGRGSPCQVFRY